MSAAVEPIREIYPERLPNALTKDFSSRLIALIDKHGVREGDSIKPMTTERLHKMLLDSAPEISISLRHVYRLINGQAVPRLDLIVALARVFDVSPTKLVPETIPVDDN